MIGFDYYVSPEIDSHSEKGNLVINLYQVRLNMRLPSQNKTFLMQNATDDVNMISLIWRSLRY